MSFEGLGITGLSIYSGVSGLVSGYTGYEEKGLTGIFYSADGSDVGDTGLGDIIKGIPVVPGDSFQVTGASAIYEYDFSIPNITSPVLINNYTEVSFNYIGLSSLGITGTLADHEYSLDNAKTWKTMTPDTGSSLVGTFSPAGTSFPFIWKIAKDIGSEIYNFPIKTRLQATATIYAEPVSTTYLYSSMYFPKTVTSPTPTTSVFAKGFKGVLGSSLLKKAPKPSQQ